MGKKHSLSETDSPAKRAATTQAAPAAASAASAAAGDNAILTTLHVDVENLDGDVAFLNRFQRMAESLFNDYVLVIGGVAHRFAELEAYFTCKKHNDPFTHKDENQSARGLFYFHRMGSSYKAGSFKGLDISIGNSREEVGGFLIRSLVSCEDGSVTCGPSKCVDRILQLCKATSIAHLVDTMLHKDISVVGDDKVIHIRPQVPRSSCQVYVSPRVGLNMKKKEATPELQKTFVCRCYRFVRSDSARFVSKAKSMIAIGCVLQKISGEEIKKNLNLQQGKLAAWTAEFEAGKKESSNAYLGVDMGDKDVLRCMGALVAEGYQLL